MAGNLVTDEYRLKDIRNGNRVSTAPSLGYTPILSCYLSEISRKEEFIRKFNAGMKAYKANGNQRLLQKHQAAIADEIIHFSFLASNFC